VNRVLFVLLAVALACTGCGGSAYDLAPVSGTVTLDGEPLAGATVLFIPIAEVGSDAGPASNGTTDAAGKYTLTSAEAFEGAVVGKHQVMITTVSDEGGDSASDDVYSDAGNQEKLPARYNAATTLKIEVPSGGTNAADFDTTSAKDDLDRVE
jgi:hypothetical protein